VKRWILLLLVLLTPGIAFAQNTSVSGTITDAGGQAWFNGTYTFTFRVSNDNPNANYKQNGAPFDKNTTISGVLDATGSLTAVPVPDNHTITPSGSSWTVQVCSAATFPCFSTSFVITGGSQNISSTVVPPAVSIQLVNPTSVNMKAYSDSEISSAVVGSTYYLGSYRNGRTGRSGRSSNSNAGQQWWRSTEPSRRRRLPNLREQRHRADQHELQRSSAKFI